jgi:hypothetical protein
MIEKAAPLIAAQRTGDHGWAMAMASTDTPRLITNTPDQGSGRKRGRCKALQKTPFAKEKPRRRGSVGPG